MGLTLTAGTLISSRIVQSMHLAADWRVLANEIVVLSHELRIQAQLIAKTKGTDAAQIPLARLAKGRVELEQTFRRLRGGVAWYGSPAMSDPSLLEVLDGSERYWRERVLPPLEMLLVEPADTLVLNETESRLEDLSISIGASSRGLERLLGKRMNNFSSNQWAVVLLYMVAMSLVSFILIRTGRRIREVSDTAKKINSGELDTRAPVSGNDEITVFAKTFNEMTSRLIFEKLTSERIIASMGEMLLVVSEQGTIQSANEATRLISGHDPAELMAKPFEELLQDGSALKEIRDAVAQSGTFSSASFSLRRKEGGTFYASLTATMLPANDRSDPSFVIVIRDISSFRLLLRESAARAAAEAAAQAAQSRATEIEGLYRELSDLRTQAFEAGKLSELGEMASGIAHEINNPITIICGKALQLKSMAEMGALDPDKVITIANQVEQTGFRVAKIVKSLRLLARDGQTECMQPERISKIISDALDLCRERFRNKGIQLDVREITEDVEIDCRSVQISQVLINLLNNAHDAVQDSAEKRVTIEVQASGETVEISVSDTGPGVPASLREKIMQPFFTTKPVGKGTGLGLSISRSIISHHQGELLLQSDSSGARFTIRLPMIQVTTSA